jgi:hypothetical protein
MNGLRGEAIALAEGGIGPRSFHGKLEWTVASELQAMDMAKEGDKAQDYLPNLSLFFL